MGYHPRKIASEFTGYINPIAWFTFVQAFYKPLRYKTLTLLGGNWNNGSNADTFYWNLNNGVSNSNRNIGTRKMIKYDV